MPTTWTTDFNANKHITYCLILCRQLIGDLMVDFDIEVEEMHLCTLTR